MKSPEGQGGDSFHYPIVYPIPPFFQGFFYLRPVSKCPLKQAPAGKLAVTNSGSITGTACFLLFRPALAKSATFQFLRTNLPIISPFISKLMSAFRSVFISTFLILQLTFKVIYFSRIPWVLQRSTALNSASLTAKSLSISTLKVDSTFSWDGDSSALPACLPWR